MTASGRVWWGASDAACRGSRGGEAEIRFTAGFGASWGDVPSDLRQAVMMLAAHFYENRNAQPDTGGLPFGVLVLLEAYRVTQIGGGAQ